jgi:phosphate transport system substrate-binding protein
LRDPLTSKEEIAMGHIGFGRAAVKACGSVAVAAACLLVAALTPAFARTQLNGAGATFPYPLYSKWFSDYHNLDPDIQINYQSIGSGGGIRQLLQGTVDFGATDGPMTDEQLGSAKVPILHIPTVLGAVVPTYNVPGTSAELRFSPETLAGIFLGTISKWNDPSLVKDNPGVTLPATDIVVVHRSDGSGTTYIWTDYLSKVSAQWLAKVGKGTSVNWPAGLGAKGNEGVSGLVKQTPGAIGYVELIYAIQNNLPYGKVRNREGVFVKANLDSVTEAARGAAENMPEDFRVSITDPPGKESYPISSFTWLLVPQRIEDPSKAKVLVGFLRWMLSEGQKVAPKLHYAPLPEPVVKKVQKSIDKIAY